MASLAVAHDAALEETFDDLVRTTFERHRLPGLAVVAVRGGTVAYARTIGHARLDTGVVVSPATLFRIASVTKTFTAVGLMRLWEQGRLQLDDPVNEHLKVFRLRAPRDAPVTFRHLLTHTSGLGLLRRPWDLVRPQQGIRVPPGTRLPSLNELYFGGLRARARPGWRWEYTNDNYGVIGQVVEDISGIPFWTYLRDAVFTPLGMSATGYPPTSASDDLVVAQGYEPSGGAAPTPAPNWETLATPAGSAYSSLDDLAKYLAFLTSGRGSVLGRTTLNRMMSAQFRVSERLPGGMGLGFFVYDVAGHRVALHSGGRPGFSSTLQVAPDDGIGVAVLMNARAPGVPEGLSMRILRALIGIPADPDAGRTALSTSAAFRRSATGTYGPAEGMLRAPLHWMGLGGGWRIEDRSARLMLRSRLRSAPIWELSVRDSTDPGLLHLEVGPGLQGVFALETDRSGSVTGLVGPSVLLRSVFGLPVFQQRYRRSSLL